MSQQKTRRRNWEEENMQRALDFYKLESSAGRKISIRRVAEDYGVPKSTLGDRITGRISSDPGVRPGPRPTLSLQGERGLVEYIKVCAQIGFGRTKQQILSIVSCIVKEGDIRNKFVEDRPGNDWWLGFIKRWPEVRLCSPQSLPRDRAIALNPNVVNNYFAMLGDILDKYNLKNKPERIFNADETGMPLDHKPPKIVKVAGQDAHTQTSGIKTNITVVACASASGLLIPPQVIFQGKRGMDQTMFQGMPPGTRVCISPNGWIDSELFETWVTEHFIKHVPASRPILLLIDGHSTHVRLDVVRKCKENGIILFALPPHTTHKLQPLDRGCFKPLKEHYKKECQKFMEENPGRVVSRFVFGKLFGAVYAKSLCPSTIINAFAKCGVFPFNPQSVLATDDMAPSLVGNTAINISTVADVTKALKVMGVFSPSEHNQSTSSLLQPHEPSIQETSACATTLSTTHMSQDISDVTIVPATVPVPTIVPATVTVSPIVPASVPVPPTVPASVPVPPIVPLSVPVPSIVPLSVPDTTFVPSSVPVSPELLTCPDVSQHLNDESPEIPPMGRQPFAIAAVDSVLNNSISTLLEKSKEVVTTKKRKLVIVARALTEDEWLKQAEEQEAKKKREEEDKENRKIVREEKRKERESEKKKKETEKKRKEEEKKRKAEERQKKKGSRKPRRRGEVTLDGDEDAVCSHCGGSFSEDNREGMDRLWVICDNCNAWMHGDECLPLGFSVQEGEAFVCPACKL